MNFLSPEFFLFLWVFLPLYHFVSRQEGGGLAGKILLLSGSLLYYSWSSPGQILLLAGVTGVAFLFGLLLERDPLRRGLLFYSLVLLLPLLVYKYLNFFVAMFDAMSGLSLEYPFRLVLPLGISFFTFQNISYVTDVARKRIRASRSYLDFFLYIAFFPRLVAGPIVTASEFLPQLERRARDRIVDYREGIFYLVSGYFKKGVLADQLALVVDPAYGHPSVTSGAALLLATLAYTLQIYFDFSGYSDIAIGLGRLFGFRLPDNFSFPYLASSFQDFWHRWHITLSVWLRDHIYIPLGGSRHGVPRMAWALLATMVLGGLWHGAHINFILWGMGHGLLLVLERLLRRKNHDASRFVKAGMRVVTFAGVALLWVLFRTGTTQGGFRDAMEIYFRIFAMVPGAVSEGSLRMVVFAYLAMIPAWLYFQSWRERIKQISDPALALFAVVATMGIVLFSPGGEGFIYFVF